jgi:methionine synthase II (cobalamin-independent)
MFATLIGAYPAPREPLAPDDAVRVTVEELAEAGLEPISDGRGAERAATPADVERIVAAWRLAASATDRAVKQALVGPYSLAGHPADSGANRATAASPATIAESIRGTIEALTAAGCPLIEIEEPAAVEVGGDEGERRRFGDALRAATTGLGDAVHLSLVITGGNADAIGAATLFDLPLSSYAFDLIAGPDNWRLIADAPGDRGIVCGALDPSADAADRPELLIWAAHYAASTGGRGLVRVGLANASSLGGLSRERARAKVEVLATAARLAASASPDELAAALDPRAVDIRSAATGRYSPAARNQPGRRR